MEEIIIDGVDVSECKYYHYKGCSATGLRCENCTCYYKQLKRLEQENEKLKEELTTERLYSSQIEEFEESLHKLKEENEDLKETIQELNESIQTCNVQRTRLYNALEEIKGTIEHFKTYFSEKELNKVKFSDITVIEEIITEAIGE